MLAPALSALEMIGTPGARQAVQSLARQYGGVEWLAQEARASAERMARPGR